jgi:hypothetical protein
MRREEKEEIPIMRKKICIKCEKFLHIRLSQGNGHIVNTPLLLWLFVMYSKDMSDLISLS